MTERRPPDPSLQVEGDELTSTDAVMADGPLTTPELPDTDGDDTVNKQWTVAVELGAAF